MRLIIVRPLPLNIFRPGLFLFFFLGQANALFILRPGCCISLLSGQSSASYFGWSRPLPLPKTWPGICSSILSGRCLSLFSGQASASPYYRANPPPLLIAGPSLCLSLFPGQASAAARLAIQHCQANRCFPGISCFRFLTYIP